MKAVVFDMDGVLFDTERVCMESWVKVAESRGMQGMKEVFPLCIGRNNADDELIIKEHYGAGFDYQGFRQEASDEFWRMIREQGLPQKKGVKELLSFLKEDGWKIGLASSTKRASIQNHLENAGILEYFSSLHDNVLLTSDFIECIEEERGKFNHGEGIPVPKDRPVSLELRNVTFNGTG